MKHKVIAVDCDDVLVETAPLILSNYNKLYGTHLELKDMYSRDLKVWDVPDAATAIARVEDYLKTDEYRRQPPLREAIEVTKRLAKHHELHIVTGRTEFLAVATQDMLDRYFSGIFQSIEDHLHHAEAVANIGIDVLLFGGYPWNRADSLPANMRRVKDWYAIDKLLMDNE